MRNIFCSLVAASTAFIPCNSLGLDEEAAQEFEAMSGYTPAETQDVTGYNPNDVKLLENQEQLPMPYLGDLDTYKERAASTEEGGSIQIWDGNKYVTVTTDGVYDGNGPDGQSGTADDGVIILYGTEDHPIKIDGMNVVEGDIIISGYYEGVGSIIGGRNLHVINDLVPVDESMWPKNAEDEEIQEQIVENSDNSMISLAVKGSVVMGDVENTFNSCERYMDCQPYSVDEADQEIGYVTSVVDGVAMFHGDYSEWDGSYRSEVKITGVHAEQNSNTIDIGNDVSKVSAGQTLIIDGETYTVIRTSNNGNVTLDKNLASDLNGTVTFLTKRRYCDPSLSDEQMAALESSKHITNIDAIMYTNHWIGGKVGNITITGSMIGRDEGMIISGGLELNWDPRIKYSPLRHILPTTIKPPRTIVKKEY